MHGSKGPLANITLHDLARDVATVIEQENAGPAVIVGHAYGNWVARMTAVDHPRLVRGVVLAAAAAKKFPPRLGQLVSKSADPAVPDAEPLFGKPGSIRSSRRRRANRVEGRVRRPRHHRGDPDTRATRCCPSSRPPWWRRSPRGCGR